MSLLRRCLLALSRRMSPRVIYDGLGARPYLSRYYLFGAPTMPDGSSPFDAHGDPFPAAVWPENTLGLYLHRFHQSDVDRELHSHPWEWAVSLVLVGGYHEERRIGDRVVSRVVRPLSLNWLRATDFHRVDLLEEEAWTLFLVGPKSSSWGFWHRRTGEFTPWREFITAKRRMASFVRIAKGRAS